jgi:nucleoside-diphosphate-sugar epimerase
MKVFMIGGTGLLGSQGAGELIRRGHSVSTIALPPIPPGAQLPEGMAIEFRNYLEMSDEQIRACLRGCDGFVFAAGVDERVEGAPPVEDLYRKYNITPLERFLRLAKESGVRHAVICGSYFVHFNHLWPDLHLAEQHPYIRSRVEQARMALSFAGDGFDVAMLELPYIFGAQPGRRPVWMFLIERILKMPLGTFYPRGGTSMVTVRQVGQCIAGALERSRGAQNYPVGYYNLEWRELLRIIHKHMGMPSRPVITIPDWMFGLYGASVTRQLRKAGRQGGLDYARFASLMCANAFIDPAIIVDKLGVTPDDIDAAIGQSVQLCLEILRGQSEAVGMPSA